jgi:hypothetical protein
MPFAFVNPIVDRITRRGGEKFPVAGVISVYDELS